ncbi:MAG: polysaccharide biosynthesis/export family protein [Thermodesulfobacteriota bacterium]
MAKRILLLFIPILIFAGCAKKVVRDDFEAEKVSVSEFTLGSGDVIEVNVWRHKDLNKKVQVDPYGKITYPLVGEIDATGLSVFTLREKLAEGLSKYLVDPQVDVSVVSFNSHKIYVLGEVNRPGIFAFQSRYSVLEAITMAGGFRQEAQPASVVLIRGGLKSSNAVTLDLKKALKKGDLADNVAIQQGDVIYVPPMFIADLSRKFRYLYGILAPIVLLEQGIALEPQVEEVLTGNKASNNTTIIIGTGGQ